MSVTLGIVALPNFDAALGLPAYASAGAAGLDIRACLAESERQNGVPLPPMGRMIVPTGLSLLLPPGHEAQVRPRSGLAARHGVTLLNTPGTIDEDYRGELLVLLANLGPELWRLTHGERVAQLVVSPVTRVAPEWSDPGADTERGTGGFGSTGRC